MSAKDLQRKLDEQSNQIVNYEKKLKDVVRAYKSLELEKKALEVALEAVGTDVAASRTASVDATGTEPPPGADDETKIAALKQALSTLTVENKRKEMAFQSDRKALITKNEQIQTQLDKLKNVQDAFSIAKTLKKGLKQSEVDKERMLADHGAVLAEMQSRFNKKHTHAEQLEKQLTETYKKLAEADEKLGKVKKLEAEVADWKTRAEGTPSVRVLREELENTRKAHSQELAALKSKYTNRDNAREDKNARIVNLEQRLHELTEESVATMQEKAELISAVDQLEKKLNFLMTESDNLKKAQRRLSMEVEEGTNTERLVECYKQCIKEKPGFDIYQCLNLPLPHFHSSERSASVNPESQSDTDAPSYCSTCELAQKDLSYFKNLIGHLQKKLRTLETSHDLMKKDHENVTNTLRTRIADLETAQEKTYAQLTAECKRKVAELEEEMTKQRARLLETINEKEREIELTKQSLAALYSSQCPDPVDPPQGKSPVSRKGSRNLRRSTDSLRSAKTYYSEDGDDMIAGSPGQVTRSLSAHLGENRNIFYEQELSRREHEIAELRHLIRLSETKVREIESATLTKDMQYLQIVETLKEEIRVLEGRLTLQKSEVNLEYLRNVFISFLNSENAKSRKHILKAIGAVLRLTPSEMRKIDAWNL